MSSAGIRYQGLPMHLMAMTCIVSLLLRYVDAEGSAIGRPDTHSVGGSSYQLPGSSYIDLAYHRLQKQKL